MARLFALRRARGRFGRAASCGFRPLGFLCPARLGGGNFFPTVQSGQHDVRVDNRRTGPDRGILLGAWIDSGIETTAKPCLEKSNDPVVLQLLADRPDEDGAHENATIT